MSFFKDKSDKEKYDWVEEHFRDIEPVKAPPYLWTRISARLTSQPRQHPGFSSVFFILRNVARWAIPVVLVLGLSFGVFVGKELSVSFCSQTQTCAGSRTANDNSYFEPGSAGQYDELIDTSDLIR